MDVSQKALLVVMAKSPLTGRVKTRLAPSVSLQHAADLYRCLLSDRILEMARLERVDLALAYTPENARAAFSAMVPEGFRLFPQQGANLDDRLIRLLHDRFADGYHAIAVTDSDTPDLARSDIDSCFELLFTNRADVVFGPCTDGGYYLVAMKRPHPGLFTDIPWSTDTVLSACLERAWARGLKTALLPCRNDIDTYADILDFYRRHEDKPLENDWPGRQTFRFIKRVLLKAQPD